MRDSALWPLVVYFAVVIASVVAVLGLSALIGQKTPVRRATAEPYESGVVPVGSPYMPIAVQFYLVAMFFVIFDLEAAYIFAWAVSFADLGWFGYLDMCVFVFVLAIALVYAWRTGALQWGAGRRANPEVPRRQ